MMIDYMFCAAGLNVWEASTFQIWLYWPNTLTHTGVWLFLTIEVVLHKLIGCVNVELQMNVVALCDKMVSLLCKINKNNNDEEVNQIRFPFFI